MHYKRWYRALGAEPKKPTAREVISKHLPGTKTEIAKATGFSREGIHTAVEKMRAEGLLHIERWKRSHRGAISPVYAAGPGVDAVCTLKAFTPKQLAKRSKANRIKDGRWEDRKSRDRMRWWEQKALTTKNTWLGALGVPP